MPDNVAHQNSAEESTLEPNRLLPPSVAHSGSRRAILEQSLLLFAEHGYGATTVRNIASAVGMLSGSLYAHFPSKENILSELVFSGLDAHHQCVRSAYLLGGDPKSQLVAFVRAHAKFHIDYPTLAIVANAELHLLPPELAQPALDIRGRSIDMLNQIIERGVKEKVFRPQNQFVVSSVIGGMGVNVARWFSDAQNISAKQLCDQLADLACSMVDMQPEQQ